MGRLLIGGAIALMAMFGYCSTKSENEITGETQYISLSREQEVALGLQAAPEMAAQFGGVVDHPLADYVAEVGERVAAQADTRRLYDYQFHVLADDKTVNAFALPGGQIFVTVAMLRELGDESELAGVLGHEVGHVVARHGAEHLAKQQLGQQLVGAVGVASWDPDRPMSSQQAAMIAAAVNQLVSLRYSREDELESDALGVRFLDAAKYDPDAMVGVMQALQRASGPSSQPEFFQTHPDPGNRIERLRALTKGLSASDRARDRGEQRYRDNVLVHVGAVQRVRGRE